MYKLNRCARRSGAVRRAHPSRSQPRTLRPLGSTEPPSAPGNSLTLRRDRFEKIFLFAPGAGQIKGIKQHRRTPASCAEAAKVQTGAGSRASLRKSGGTLVPPAPRLRPDLCRVAVPVGLFCFVGAFFSGLLPAVGTRLRGQNEPIFQGSFCRFPVREVSGIGLQPCPPSGAAQPPPAGTESTPFGVCASSVCTYIALHIKRLTGLLE